jgi:hypothetical protein
VRYALAQQRAGLPVTHEILLEGVLTYAEYLHRRATWDPVRQCIGLDAEFYKGAQLLLFPPHWLNHAEVLADSLRVAAMKARIAKSIGIDPAEGGDRTSMCCVDELGIIDLVSRKTPNTDDVPGEAIAFGRKYKVPPENWVFDRGGGGKQHADRLRGMGYPVRTVSFGERPILPPKSGRQPITARKEVYEEKTTYVNRRAEMYWEASSLVDPTRLIEGVVLERQHQQLIGARSALASRLQALLEHPTGFAIPARFETVYCEKHGLGCLRHQLALMPKLYDKEGRCRMLPKDRPTTSDEAYAARAKKEKTLIELIGHSPDEADAYVLAVYGMLHKPVISTAGVP